MKPVTIKKTSSVIAALGMGAGLLAAPAISQAEDGLSTGMNVSSMYLWRGIDVSYGAPAVSGSVEYSISGLTLGTWASSEGPVALGYGGSEWDLYVTYGLDLGGVGLTVGYFEYMYPEAGADMSKTDISEYFLGVDVADFSLGVYQNTQVDYTYVSADYAMGAYGIHLGSTMDEADDSDYIDANVSYAMSDAASVTVSKVMADSATIANLGINDNPLIVFSYDIPL